MTASFGVSMAMAARLVGSVALAILSGASAAVAAPALGFQPHIVHVLTDDQDLTLRSMQAMPQLSALVNKAGGFNFTNAFVATPICCPSRASYLSGQYTHNHRTLQNSPATGWLRGVARRLGAEGGGARARGSGLHHRLLRKTPERVRRRARWR